MFSKNTELENILSEKHNSGEFLFTDAAILGGAFTSTESPFDCFIEIWNCERLSGDRWNGDDNGIMQFNKADEIEFSVLVDEDELLIVDIKAESVDMASELGFDEVGFADQDGTGTADYKPADQVYRLITSTAQGPAAMRKIVLRLGDQDQTNPAPQSDWTVEHIKIWKATIS